MNNNYKVYRNTCPRNCYDTCGILTYVKNNKIVKVTGDPSHGFTKGHLCSKGYNYIKMVYNKERLKYPLRQKGRGSGIWERITWEQALDMICEKILKIKEKYTSTLPICLNKYSGNFGLLQTAVEGMFNSLGPTTQAIGSPCWSAGLDAQYYDFGGNFSSDPNELLNAKLIVLWGANPAWTSVHSFAMITQAQERGTKVVVIDPIYTQTAKKADWYIQIKPGGDGSFALALIKIINKMGKIDHNFINNHTIGWENFSRYLDTFSLEEAAEDSGQSIEIMEELAELIVNNSPCFFWVGFGLQRHANGGQNVRAIDALGAVTGNIGISGGGVHYANLKIWNMFNYSFLKTKHINRYVNINNFAAQLQKLQEPPIEMLWNSCRNLVRQDTNSTLLIENMRKIDFIVTVDLFLTDTACESDLVLPATTFFENLDVVPSYWHTWLSINEKAITPYYESKSDFEIAKMVSSKLNKLKPGSSNFPNHLSEEDFLDNEFSQETYDSFGIKHWDELRQGPKKYNGPSIAWKSKIFKTPSGKYEFFSNTAVLKGLPGLPIKKNTISPNKKYPYWLLTPHYQHRLNSQFQHIDRLKKICSDSIVYLNPVTAKNKHIKNGCIVKIYNELGSITCLAAYSENVAQDTIIYFQGVNQKKNNMINSIIKGIPTDMGEKTTDFPGMAFYDTHVNIEPVKITRS